MWMNEFEVLETLSLTADEVDTVPNLYTGARVLHALMEWTNANSDGWPYWPKPGQAASKLMETLHDRHYALRFGSNRDGSPLTDVCDSVLVHLLVPIKSFLKRQGVEYDAELPWAALFPVV